MKDYSKMSDFEIDGYVSMHEHGFSWIEFDDEMSSHVKCGNEGSPGFAIVEVKDYCNNPSDAWTIIFVNDIMLNPNCVDALWKAEQGFREKPSGFYSAATAYSNNPLRAAMIVYLMMKEEEK